MTRFYDLDSANAALPELRDILMLLRDHRATLIELRDELLEYRAAIDADEEANVSRIRPKVEGRAVNETRADAEVRRIRLRMQGLIDQMQAAVSRIDEMDVTLRDIESGLIDFPALVNGRQVWLCWRLGEGPVEWWHELSSGFGGRQPLAELR